MTSTARVNITASCCPTNKQQLHIAYHSLPSCSATLSPMLPAVFMPEANDVSKLMYHDPIHRTMFAQRHHLLTPFTSHERAASTRSWPEDDVIVGSRWRHRVTIEEGDARVLLPVAHGAEYVLADSIWENIHAKEDYVSLYAWLKCNLGHKYHAPQVQPGWGLNL